MFALSEYALTGGPDKSVLAPANADYETIKQVMDRLVDRTLACPAEGAPVWNAYRPGYTVLCYGVGCKDSSTTQFAVAGLAAAKAFYSSNKSGDQAFARRRPGDGDRFALALTRKAYELNAYVGSDNANCFTLTATERGAGYNAQFGSVGGYRPSLQQTASGIYIQLFGGANVNTPALQNYLEWVRNRYRCRIWTALGTVGPTILTGITCGVRSKAWS